MWGGGKVEMMLRWIRNGWGVYGNWRIGSLFLLGFASGLPLLLIASTLQAWMTEAGLDTVTIGLFAILNFPYSFKFVWSPLLDRFIPPAPGRLQGSRRRGWLVLTQVLLIVAIMGLGRQDPTHVSWFLTAAMIVAFLGASQDIAADAYRTDVLTEAEMGAGAAIFVLGYRIALLTSGGIALILADHLSWFQVYTIMALLMLIGVITTYFAAEPEQDSPPPSTLTDAVVKPFQAFLQKRGAILILAFILLYKLADGLAGQMTTTFLLDTGFSKTDLGLIRSGIGLLATLGGTLIGGLGVSRLGIYSALLLFGILQGLSNLGFVGVASLGQNYPAMVGAIILENGTGGMGTAAFLAFLMSLCDRQFSATQYALLSSLFAIGGIVSGSISGYLASLGWIPFFFLTTLGAVPSLLLLWILIVQTKTQARATPEAG